MSVINSIDTSHEDMIVSNIPKFGEWITIEAWWMSKTNLLATQVKIQSTLHCKKKLTRVVSLCGFNPKVKRGKPFSILFATRYLCIFWWNHFEINILFQCMGCYILGQSNYTTEKWIQLWNIYHINVQASYL